MYTAVHELNNNSDRSIIVENKDGLILQNGEQRVERITEHLKLKLNKVTSVTYLIFHLGNSIVQSQQGKLPKQPWHLKNSKSPGCDNVQTELIKYGSEIIHRQIAHILNHTAETGEYPEEVKFGQLLSFPKPGKPKGPVKKLK